MSERAADCLLGYAGEPFHLECATFAFVGTESFLSKKKKKLGHIIAFSGLFAGLKGFTKNVFVAKSRGMRNLCAKVTYARFFFKYNSCLSYEIHR